MHFEMVPAPDPWEVARRFAAWPHLLFLDSADRTSDRGRYSFVAADPVEWRTSWKLDPFAELAADLPRRETILGLPPFQGGWAGLFGYGLQHVVEKLPRTRFDEFRTPDLAVGLYDWVIAWDHAQDRAWIVAEAASTLERVKRQLAEKGTFSFSAAEKENVPFSALAPQFALPGHPGVTSNFDRAGYLAAVRRAIDYVHAGDCFQLNLSQRLLAPLRDHPLELYGRLRAKNPAPFAGYLDLGDAAVVSASPERFLRVVNGSVETRPIKGTRPRGATLAEDAARAADLAASSKDRAENVMIVDLMRNDLGRVCDYGSVRVPQVCEVESYRYVHHLVSAVRGQLSPGKGPLDLLRACFPGGSVTGAPKVRAMEIIAELEPTARGPYCGSLGYIGCDGSMDTSILIRTFTAAGGWVQFPVGGGIVADSDPAREYDETLHKAQGLLQAVRVH